MVEQGGFGARRGSVGVKPPMEALPPELPAPLASALARRYEQLPVVRVRSRRDIRRLDHTESRWIRRAVGRYSPTDAAPASIEEWWLAQVARACGGVVALLEQLEMAGVTPELPLQPWRPTWLFQLWWNTLGPGARTWMRNRRASFRDVIRSFHRRQ